MRRFRSRSRRGTSRTPNPTAVSPARYASALHVTVAIALAFVYSISFAALIFSGTLHAGFGAGVEAGLVAVAVVGAAVAIFSRFPIAFAGPDSNPTAVLVLAGAGLPAMLAAERVSTMLAIVVLTTAVTGIALFAAGAWGAARVIRYIPEPMIGGFNAASGALVLLGALHVLGPHPAGALIVASLLCGVVFFALQRWPVAVPLLFIGSLAVLPAYSLLAHVRLDALHREGWLFTMPHAAPAFAWNVLRAPVAWNAVLASLPQMLVVAAVAAATLLLNAGGLELLTHVDVDLDRELRVAGIANLGAAVLGGFVGILSFARSSILYTLGVRSRYVTLVAAVAAAIALIAGPWRVVDAIPVFAPAGLLMALGAGIAKRWLFGERRSSGDAVTMWTIVAITIWLGFVPGIVAGLAVGCVTFVVRYGRVDPIEYRWDGTAIRSSLQRSAHESSVLAEHGDHVRIFTLRGFIFFGIADRIYRELLELAQQRENMLWIVLDFSDVTGIDTSATAAFVKFARAIDADRVQFMVCGMPGPVAALWNARLGEHLRPLAFEDRDQALEYCEGQVLLLFDSYEQEPAPFERWLDAQFGSELAASIRGALVPLRFDTGDVLGEAGERADRMFFIERGRVAVLAGGERLVRLRSIGALSMIGEMGLYHHAPRTATLVAEMPTIVRVLTRDALDTMEATDPHAANAFHGIIVRLLAERLEYQNRAIAALSG
jgi:SulP family sulfate permease